MPPETNADTTSTGERVLVDRHQLEATRGHLNQIFALAEAILSYRPGHPLESDLPNKGLFGIGGQFAVGVDPVDEAVLLGVDPGPTDQRPD